MCVGVKDRSARATGTSGVGCASRGAHTPRRHRGPVQCAAPASRPRLSQARGRQGGGALASRARCPACPHPAPASTSAPDALVCPPSGTSRAAATPSEGLPRVPPTGRPAADGVLRPSWPLPPAGPVSAFRREPALPPGGLLSRAVPRCSSQPRQLTVEDGRPVPNALWP